MLIFMKVFLINYYRKIFNENIYMRKVDFYNL